MVKPAGTNGFFRVRASSNGDIIGSFEKVALSEEKAAIELQTVSRFIRTRSLFSMLLFVARSRYARYETNPI